MLAKRLAPTFRGVLHRGDNVDVMRRHVGDASIDLVYLDPPFDSQRSYDAVLKKQRDKKTVFAFEDAWRWTAAAERELDATCARSDSLATLLRGLLAFLGPSPRMAYLTMIAARLVEVHRVLKPTGSVYLHCDPTASHYLKLLLDAVLGPRAFKNEIVWRYRRWPAKSRAFQRMHDVLFFYAKDADNQHVFNTLYGYESLAPSTKKTFGNRKQVADFSSGHRKPGKLDVESAGPPLSDVWEIGVIAPIGKERVGYPTQKPEALLERILLASTEPGAVVLDPFCGSGSTLAVAERLGRSWIGIDKSDLAISIARDRLAALHSVHSIGR